MTVDCWSVRDRHVVVMVSVTEETLYLSGLLAGVTVMTLMTLIYGLILDEGMRLYFVGPYPFNLTRRTRRGGQGAPYLCGFLTYDRRRVSPITLITRRPYPTRRMVRRLVYSEHCRVSN
jgi:hypothetical protein